MPRLELGLEFALLLVVARLGRRFDLGYIIKENRTYDQILSNLPQGNGDIDLLQFGREVTPNQHAIAEQFVLFDNLYDSGSNSADGYRWVTQAFVPDYLEKSYGGFVRTMEQILGLPPMNQMDMAVDPTGMNLDSSVDRSFAIEKPHER